MTLLRSALRVSLGLLLAACSADGTSPSPTGQLAIVVSGLPPGVDAGVTIAGPGGFAATARGSGTLSGLDPGAYAITASPVVQHGHTWTPSPPTQTATVTTGATTTAGVAYTVTTGALTLTVLGLPTGAPAQVTVSGPGGFSETVTETHAFVGLVPGNYTVSAASVTVTGDVYQATPVQITMIVPADTTPSLVQVAYAVTTGRLGVGVSGLPTGATANIQVTGPGTSTVITATTTLAGLAPGTYTVAAVAIVHGGQTFTPSPTSQTAAVSVGATASVAVAYSISGPPPPPPPPPPPGVDLTVPVPLGEMGNDTWRGFHGGHYPGGEAIPPAHFDEGVRRARAIGPLNQNGQPDPAGSYVLLSVGMSNTTQEYCSGAFPSCSGYSFIGQAAADPAVRQSGLVLVDGAAGSQTALTWDNPSDANYDRVRDTRLAPLGLTEQQVRVVWLKVVNPQPTVSLPNPSADAFQLLASLGAIARALKVRYPNLELVFLSNRTYGGYATITLHPEPYAYETGFAVKWLVEAQIAQMAGGPPDARAGNLAYTGASAAAPWLAWGPDLWANGTTPRADGLVWVRSDFASDGIHPSTSGRTKVGRLLLDFFKGAPVSRCWFVVGGACG